jgi:flagellar hook-associated protein 2
MTALINFGGLASGLDTNAIIDALVNVEKQPITALQSKVGDIAQAKSVVTSISGKLSSLQAAAKALSDPSGFASAVASSSDSSVVATVTGTAPPGAFDVNVTQIAKEQRTYSTTFASNTDPLGQSGTIQLQVGSGSPVTVNVSAGDSLATIAANLNTSGARISAAVLYDGSTYRLQVRGLDTGAANAVSFTESGTSFGLSDPANTFQPAQDAKLTVDGIDVTRSTNQISGVIAGVTLALTKPTSSPASIRVASDSTAIATKISSFVSAYNAVVDAGHSAAGFGTTKASVTSLTADFTINNALERLASLQGNNVAGTSGLYTTFASVGINSTQDGHLTFDATKLSTAVQLDATTVSRLFVTDTSIGATGLMSNFVSTIDSLVNDSGNPFAARLASFDTQTKALTADEERLQVQLDAYQTALKNSFTRMELAVSTYKSQTAQLTAMSNAATGTSSTG